MPPPARKGRPTTLKHPTNAQPNRQQVSFKLYGELAGWWSLLSAPDDYAEEAGFTPRIVVDAYGRDLFVGVKAVS